MIFIGHNIYHVYDIADRFFVIDRGREAFEGPKAGHNLELRTAVGTRQPA